MSETPAILITFWRNLEWYTYQRGWRQRRYGGPDYDRLAEQLGVSKNTLARLRFGRSRYIDPDILVSAIEVFNLTPNDLLLTNPEVEKAYAEE